MVRITFALLSLILSWNSSYRIEVGLGQEYKSHGIGDVRGLVGSLASAVHDHEELVGTSEKVSELLCREMVHSIKQGSVFFDVGLELGKTGVVGLTRHHRREE